jgi:hypothetical protein
MIEINDNEIGKTEEMNLLIDIQTTIEEHLESLPLGDRDKPFHKDIVAHYEKMNDYMWSLIVKHEEEGGVLNV